MLNHIYLSSFFFFKQKTAYEMRISDWSSDVCSSDLLGDIVEDRLHHRAVARPGPLRLAGRARGEEDGREVVAGQRRQHRRVAAPRIGDRRDRLVDRTRDVERDDLCAMFGAGEPFGALRVGEGQLDRKSTRLNSS